LSFTTTDSMLDSRADCYLSVSRKFADKLKRLIHIKEEGNFNPRWVGKYQGGVDDCMDSMMRAHFTVQDRTVEDDCMVVLPKQSHDLIIGWRWMARWDVLLDCRHRRLVIPELPSAGPRLEEKYRGFRPGRQTAGPKHQEDIARREKLMAREDKQRRNRPDVLQRIRRLEEFERQQEL
ncbi:hypothetical protein B0H66DRAFT_467773, partial [Apodospora peruviana]